MHRLLLAALLVFPAARAQFTLQTSNTAGRPARHCHWRCAWADRLGQRHRRHGRAYRRRRIALDPPAPRRRAPKSSTSEAFQAFDAQNAVVMSSGKGDASRVYKTDNGCKTWKLVFSNPDTPGGFFDAIVFTRRDAGWLLGDPVNGRFYLALTQDGGETWTRVNAPSLSADEKNGRRVRREQSSPAADRRRPHVRRWRSCALPRQVGRLLALAAIQRSGDLLLPRLLRTDKGAAGRGERRVGHFRACLEPAGDHRRRRRLHRARRRLGHRRLQHRRRRKLDHAHRAGRTATARPSHTT